MWLSQAEAAQTILEKVCGLSHKCNKNVYQTKKSKRLLNQFDQISDKMEKLITTYSKSLDSMVKGNN